jgi:hypothetical protein
MARNSPSALLSGLALLPRAARFFGEAILRGVAESFAGEAERLARDREGVDEVNSGGGNSLLLSMVIFGGLVMVALICSLDPISIGALSSNAAIQGVILYSAPSFKATKIKQVSKLDRKRIMRFEVDCGRGVKIFWGSGVRRSQLKLRCDGI